MHKYVRVQCIKTLKDHLIDCKGREPRHGYLPSIVLPDQKTCLHMQPNSILCPSWNSIIMNQNHVVSQNPLTTRTWTHNGKSWSWQPLIQSFPGPSLSVDLRSMSTCSYCKTHHRGSFPITRNHRCPCNCLVAQRRMLGRWDVISDLNFSRPPAPTASCAWETWG